VTRSPRTPPKTRMKRMERAVAYMKKFMDTYDQQQGYGDYSDETYINDVLYGLGASLSGEYEFAGGFRKFRALLLEHLQKGNV
jgi:hypothetical protein